MQLDDIVAAFELPAAETLVDGTIVVPVMLSEARQAKLYLQTQDVRSSKFQIYTVDSNGYKQDVAAPAITTFRGTVDRDTNTKVLASFNGQELQATISYENDEPILIKPVKLVSGKQLHVVRHAAHQEEQEKIEAGHKRCGVVKNFPENLKQEQLGDKTTENHSQINSSTQQIYGLNFYIDKCRRNLFTTDQHVVSDVESLLLMVSDIYEVYFGIRFEVNSIVIDSRPGSVSCNTIITERDAEGLLFFYTLLWAQDFAVLGGDLTHFISGYTVDALDGLSWQGGVCRLGAMSGSFNLSDNSLLNRTALMAHELGHTFNAAHCDGDLDCAIMSSLPSLNLTFGARSRASISNYASLLSCFDPNEEFASLPFTEPFTTARGSGYQLNNWSFMRGANLGQVDPATPLGGYALRLANTATGSQALMPAEIRSNRMALGSVAHGHISYQLANFDAARALPLKVEYLSSSGSWTTLAEHAAADVGRDIKYFSYALPAQAKHKRFQLRFKSSASTNNHGWIIDDVKVTPIEGVEAQGPIFDLVGEITPYIDLNRDGFADILLSKPAMQGGVVRVIDGKTKRPFMLHQHNSTYAQELYGKAVAVVGDVDGDAIADYAIGAPLRNSMSGAVEVYSGATASRILLLTPPSWVRGLGWSIAAAGDVNRDGHADILVGAPYSARPDVPLQSGYGAALIYSGANGDLLASVYGSSASKYFGYYIINLGDLDNDGNMENVIIDNASPSLNATRQMGLYSGLLNLNYSYEISGTITNIKLVSDFLEVGSRHIAITRRFSLGSELTLYNANNFGRFITFRPLASEGGAESFGQSVTTIDDLDGDNKRELVVATPNGNLDRGRVSIYSSLNQQIIGSFLGDQILGRPVNVQRAGDMNGDGISDLSIIWEMAGSYRNLLYSLTHAPFETFQPLGGLLSGENSSSLKLVPMGTAKAGDRQRFKLAGHSESDTILLAIGDPAQLSSNSPFSSGPWPFMYPLTILPLSQATRFEFEMPLPLGGALGRRLGLQAWKVNTSGVRQASSNIVGLTVLAPSDP